VYAGLDSHWADGITYGHAAFKSTNGGRTWRELALRGDPVAVTPTVPPTVYAAAGGPGGTSRLLKSTDGGRSWHAADRGLPATYLWALAFDPSSPATVYAAMGEQGAFVSIDSGASWRELDISHTYGPVTAIVVDPQRSETVYAATNAGVIESRDRGGSWRMVNAALGSHDRDRGYMQVSGLLVDPRDSQTVYASTRCTGVFKSTDAGHSWSAANTGLDPGCGLSYSLALDPRDPQALYAADTGRGVFKSIDRGEHWQATNAGLSLSTVFSVAVAPNDPPTVYAAGGGLGLFRSSDGGSHWQALAPNIKLVDDVIADPSNPAHVLAVVPGYGIVRSIDAGTTWTGARAGPPARGVDAVAISGETAYAGTQSQGFFASSDGGRTFRKVGALDVQALAIAPGNVVYVGSETIRDNGVYKSTDGGRSWQRLYGTGVGVIALDSKRPSTIYIGASGVLKSVDGGASWRRADSGLPRLRLKNRETGKPYVVVDAPTALVIDPIQTTTLYAAVYQHGVFRSTNAGKSWQPLNAGLDGLDVRTLALDPTGTTLYAGTSGGGVVSFRTG
jgi:photosystem II stability/assembly factor-like uncharacterized protein